MKRFHIYISHHAKKIIALETHSFKMKDQLDIVGYNVVYHGQMKYDQVRELFEEYCPKLEYVGEMYIADENDKPYLSLRYSKTPQNRKLSIFQQIRLWLLK